MNLTKKFLWTWKGTERANPIELVPEFKFHPFRKWRFDFCHPETGVAIELEGGVWTGGRHTRSSGFISDLEKYNEATFLGWKVFRFSAEQINVPNLERVRDFILKQHERK